MASSVRGIGGPISTGAWADAFNALGRMLGVAGPAFVAVTLVSAVPLLWLGSHPFHPAADATLWRSAWSAALRGGMVGWPAGVLEAVLMTPVAIAIHRLILLGEVTAFYRLDLGSKRFRRFAGYMLVLNIGSTLLIASGALLGFLSTIVAVVVCLALWIGATIIGTRLVLLFPSIAIDSRHADWQGAMALSRHHAWSIFGALLVTSLLGGLLSLIQLPLEFLGVAVVAGGNFVLGNLIKAAGQALLHILITAALVAAASRIYRNLSGPDEPEAIAPPQAGLAL